MSQITCLPLPNKRERRRLAKKHQKENQEKEEEGGAGPVEISELQNMNAMEYLAAVSRQANSLPLVVCASSSPPTDIDSQTKDTNNKNDIKYVPVDGSAAMAHYLISSHTELEPCTIHHLPPKTEEWVDATLADFSSLRDYMDRCGKSFLVNEKRRRNGDESSSSSSGRRIRVAVPQMKDVAGWHEFCLGVDEAEGNVGGYFDDDDDDANYEHEEEEYPIEGEEHEQHEDTQHTFSQTYREHLSTNGKPPTIQLLLQLDQVMTRRVLLHHINWLSDGYTMTRGRGAWIYALLARLEKPLHREEAAMLRRLLKECCRLRCALTKEEVMEHEKLCEGGGVEQDLLPTVNVIICLVGLYFEQGPGVMRAGVSHTTTTE